MTDRTNSSERAGEAADFATLHFERDVTAPLTSLWKAWTAPAARAVWSAPDPLTTVDIIESETRVGSRELSICKVAGQPDTLCECGWLDLRDEQRSVHYEIVSTGDERQSAALVTASFSGDGDRSKISVTVQLASLARDMADEYREGFAGGLANLAEVAERTMILQRRIAVPRPIVWRSWMNEEALPQWWGPDGFTCRTERIDLRSGGDWVFDMIAPDGTVFPNHHRYTEVRPEDRIAYALLWGEDGPKHADAWAELEEEGDSTLVTLGMVFSAREEFETARGFGAVELGLQTLGKLERFARSQQGLAREPVSGEA